MKLGTVETRDGYAYDRHQNEALAQNIVRVTAMPSGRPAVNYDTDNSEFATIEAAVAFARVLHAKVIEAADPNYPGYETRTFTTSYPKYVLLVGEKRVNAGAIATILGNDSGFGLNDGAKAGPIAQLLGEEYDAAVHIPLVRALRAAIGA